MVEIPTRAAGAPGLSAAPEAAGEAARRSRKTPRLARKLIERAGEFAHVRGSGRIEGEDVFSASESFGIDAFGLKEDDRRILDLLAQRSALVGIDTIAATLNLDRLTVRQVHERWLLAEGLVRRTARGRALTTKGREVLATSIDTSGADRGRQVRGGDSSGARALDFAPHSGSNRGGLSLDLEYP